MRTCSDQGLVTGLAMAGTRAVCLGWDMPAAEIANRGVIGFAIERTRE